MFKSNFTKIGFYIHLILFLLMTAVFISYLLSGSNGELNNLMSMTIGGVVFCMCLNLGIMRYKQGKRKAGILYLGVTLIPIMNLFILIFLL